MHYLVGDLQGCDDAFERLLAEVAFSPSRDRLTVLGDMINRGPSSLAVLRRLRGLGDAAQSLLGNHDLHFLAVAKGVRPAHGSDTLQPVLDDAEREAWVEWVRHRPLALRAEGWLCVHAGLPPQWDGARTLALAAEVEAMLRSGDLEAFLRVMYGNEPARWDESLHGADRWRFVINALTRMRFCTADGTLDFKTKDSAEAAPPGHYPWYDVPGRRSAGERVACGHWSTLGLVVRQDLLALDTGCVWGRSLSAARVDGGRREIVQVRCTPARHPG
jgi:bis(5'-nucleosyl)-tetraphosphatase (symmetrical)